LTVSSERDSRQRAAARARLEREMAARRESARRKRLMQARIGAGVAGAVVLGAVIWIIVAASDGGEPAPTATSAGPCVYYEDYPTADASGSPIPLPSGVKDVGKPPADPPTSGFQVLTIETNLGKVEVEMDYSKTRCTANSMAHLASQGFYDNTSCHRLVTDIFALQCGDPTGTGTGGATYRFDDENLPTNKLPAYHAGDVAMANTGQPGSNGTQFFFVYDTSSLQGNYSLWGRVISGLDIVKQVAAAGDNGEYAAQAGGGRPNQAFTFTKVTAGPITPTSAAPASPSPIVESPSPSATGSPSPAAS
jgi:peptidyl-prolyl cis-trans isomerase B (cyclophilin B)